MSADAEDDTERVDPTDPEARTVGLRAATDDEFLELLPQSYGTRSRR